MRRIVVGSVLALAFFIPAQQALSATAADAARARFTELQSRLKTGTARRIGPQLAAIDAAAATATLQRRSAGQAALISKLRGLRTKDGYVSVSAYPEDVANVAALRTALVSKGMVDARAHENGVSGRVPLAALGDIAGTPGLRFLRPAIPLTHAGLVTTQGDHAMRSDVARRRFGVTGRNVRVGVMSDSYNCLEGPLIEGGPYTTAADDMASGDLPRDVIVLKDLSDVPSPDCTDEGRALMQLIHDVAPGSTFAFYTAFESQEDFADGVLALAKAGANIIVDDVIYLEEPMFQDGAIAQNGAQVVARGGAYFSSAGNEARQSYQAPFRNSGLVGLSGRQHDFDAGRGVDTLQSVTATSGSVSILSLQWDQPFFSVSGKTGSASDVDAYYLDADGVPIELCTDDPEQVVCQIPGFEANIGADALEEPILVNFSDTDLEAQLAIELYAGPRPQLLKYVWFDFAGGIFIVNEYDTESATIFGHANGPGIEAVGAAGFYNTAVFGGGNHPECAVGACLQNFSSAGGVPILFDKKGRRLPFPEVRVKPGVTGPDGGDTTFFFADLSAPIPGTDEPNGNPNFFGTSASAPHVAGVAALMIEKRHRDSDANRSWSGQRELSADAIYRALRSTAGDVRFRAGITSGPFYIAHGRGYDFDSGFGFVDAAKALQAIGD